MHTQGSVAMCTSADSMVTIVVLAHSALFANCHLYTYLVLGNVIPTSLILLYIYEVDLYISIGNHPIPQVKQTIDKLQVEFESILYLTQQSFRSDAVPVEKFRLKVASLCASQKQNIPMYDQSIKHLVILSSCDEIFSFLTHIKVWDILNFRVLQKIVEKFIPDNGKVCKKIDEYAKKVEEFKVDTYLRDYIQVRYSHSTVFPSYSTLMAKIDRDYKKFTLADVARQQQFLANEFLLSEFIFRMQHQNTDTDSENSET